MDYPPAMDPPIAIKSEEFAVPHSDEWGRLARTLVEIRANRGDGEEEAVDLST